MPLFTRYYLMILSGANEKDTVTPGWPYIEDEGKVTTRLCPDRRGGGSEFSCKWTLNPFTIDPQAVIII